MKNKTEELELRSDGLGAAIATVSSQIEQIEATGEVAPPGCCVLRTLAALYQCWSDLYDNSGSQNKRTARKSGSRSHSRR